MGKHKDGKKDKKGSQLVIRVDKAERDAFVSLCDALDTSAAREIRRFMREWVAAKTSKPTDVREDAARSAVSPEAATGSAANDILPDQAEETAAEAADAVSAAEPAADVAEEVKPRRKAAKQQ